MAAPRAPPPHYAATFFSLDNESVASCSSSAWPYMDRWQSLNS